MALSAEAIGAFLDDILAEVKCRVRGHDWRVWSVVGHDDLVSNPVCERCRRTLTPREEKP